MSKETTFETLALELSPAERMDLLDRLKKTCVVSTEPMNKNVGRKKEQIDYNAVFLSLGFVARLLITIKSIFSRTSRDELVKGKILKELVKSIDTDSPGLIEGKSKSLSEVFYRELYNLRAAARYFYDILDKTLEKNRIAFFAFLASLELEDIHNELANEADPYSFAEMNEAASDSDIRVAVYSAMEQAFAKIDEEKRKHIYYDVRSLHIIKKLSGFLFDRLLGSFETSQAGFKTVQMYSVQEQLAELCSIVSSLDQPPSRNLMEAIIGFALNDEIGKENFNLDEAVSVNIADAEKALSAIRNFNDKVPLESLLKIAHDDPDWQCSSSGGGEDWYAIYKSYWKDRIDKRYHNLVSERRLKELESEIEKLVGRQKQSWFINLSQSGSETKIPLRLASALYFLEAFYHHCFLVELNRSFKLVLLEGEFYRRDNRLDFTDAYNELLQTGDKLKRLDSRLAANGELGLAYIQAKTELSSVSSKQRKIEASIRAAENEAEALLTKTTLAIKKMLEILEGILARDIRGRFDSLSNLGQIEGKANKDFIKGLEASRLKLDKAVYLIAELVKTALGSKI